MLLSDPSVLPELLYFLFTAGISYFWCSHSNSLLTSLIIPLPICSEISLCLLPIVLLYAQLLLLNRILPKNILKCTTSLCHFLKGESLLCPLCYTLPCLLHSQTFCKSGAYCLCFHASNSLFHSLHSVFINLTRMFLTRFPTTSFLTDGHFLDPPFHSFLMKVFP